LLQIRLLFAYNTGRQRDGSGGRFGLIVLETLSARSIRREYFPFLSADERMSGEADTAAPASVAHRGATWDTRRMRVRVLGFASLLLLGVAAVRADEIRLKDGTKIIGTIVGYEDYSFKVQTSYGFALVRKDKVAEIIPSNGADQPSPAHGGSAQAEPKPNESTASAPTNAGTHPERTPATKPASTTASGPPTPAPPAASPSNSATPVAQANPAQQSPAAQTPPPPPAPPPIREEVVQNLYINHTGGFQLYKPPSWDVLPDERSALPNAVAALGTSDGTTLLVVGREKLHGTLESQAAATDAQLREVYENYRLLETEQKTVAGLPAIERKFRGTVEDHDWSVTVLSVARGGDLFTILGMTYADSDLIQIQENVIARAMSSLQFSTP